MRWQHRLKRETPNLQRAKMLINDCGWKGGDSGNWAEGESCSVEKKNMSTKKTFLTETCLLMEDVSTSLPFPSPISSGGRSRRRVLSVIGILATVSEY